MITFAIFYKNKCNNNIKTKNIAKIIIPARSLVLLAQFVNLDHARRPAANAPPIYLRHGPGLVKD